MKYEVSVGIILIKSGIRPMQVLLMKRSNDELWDFPKGHLLENESPETATKRELLEETQISDINLSKDFKEEFTFVNPKGVSRKIILFLAETKKEPRLSEEHSEFRWCSFEEAYELVKFKERKQVLKKVVDYMVKGIFCN